MCKKRFKLCTECGKKATALPQTGEQRCTSCWRHRARLAVAQAWQDLHLAISFAKTKS